MSQENDDTHVENADTDSTASAPMDISETIGPATMEYIVSNFTGMITFILRANYGIHVEQNWVLFLNDLLTSCCCFFCQVTEHQDTKIN